MTLAFPVCTTTRGARMAERSPSPIHGSPRLSAPVAHSETRRRGTFEWIEDTLKKLFVGGLSWDTSTDGLRNAFTKFGAIEDAIVLTDRETGRSRGFGFVTFKNDTDGDRAMAEMNGQQIDGRAIKVDHATSATRSNDRGSGGNGGGRGGW
jgi:cold-inducible RNA-binding protein